MKRNVLLFVLAGSLLSATVSFGQYNAHPADVGYDQDDRNLLGRFV